MATQKLSAITASGSNLVSADTLVGVHSGTTDLLFSGTQIAAFVNASPTITGHETIEGVTATGATGTGNFVFDGSPTLVTPNIGTPSAGVLTNCTGLPVAGGGTGRASLTNHGVLVGAATSAVTMLAAAAAGTLLQGAGASADPAFTATPVLGVAGTTAGTLGLSGATSGVVSILTQAAAGTYNFNLPTGAGNSGDVLTSGGGGSTPMSWVTPIAINNLTDTWNNIATTFTAIKMNVTDTNSASASLLLDLQIGSATKFNVRKDGTATAVVAVLTPSLTLGTVSSATGTLNLANASSANLTTIQAGNAANARTYTWPTDFGAAGTVLTDAAGNGTLSWAAGGGGLTINSTTISGGGTNAILYGDGTKLQNATGLTRSASGTLDATTGYTINTTTILTAPAAHTLQLGAADGASPVAQTLQVQNVVAGTSNTAGANLTINGSIGTGTGAGGSIIFQTSKAGTTGTSQNSLTAQLTIDSLGNLNVPPFQFSSATQAGALIKPSTVSTGYGVGMLGTLLIYGSSAFSTNGGGVLVGEGSPGTGVFMKQTGIFGWSNTTAVRDSTTIQTFITSPAAATVQLGGPAAASPINQILQAQGSRSIDTNAGGGTLTIQPGTGSGTGTASSLIFKAPILAASGTTLQTQTLAMTIIGAANGQLPSVVFGGSAANATNATDGFIYIPTCAGTPTGTPTTQGTGTVAIQYDTTNHEFWIYDSGWKQPKTPAGAAIVTWQ